MPNLNITGTTTFTQIQQQFAPGRRGGDEHIRSSDAKGLYTSSKASLTGLKAKLGFTEKMEDRRTKRAHGKAEIKGAIDREFNKAGLADRVLAHLNNTRGMHFSGGITRGDLAAVHEGIGEVLKDDIDREFNMPGLADRVLAHLNNTRGMDFSGGITGGDLGAIREGIYEVLRDAALADPDRAALDVGGPSNKPNPNTLLRFMGNHFDICTHPQFWQYQNAKMNADIFGCALSLAVLDRIQAQGSVTQQDLNDLQRALGPYNDPYVSAPPQLPATLVGTPADLTRLTQAVFDRFAAPGADRLVNVQGQDCERDVRATFANPLNDGATRLTALHSLFNTACGAGYLGPNTFLGAINNITAAI